MSLRFSLALLLMFALSQLMQQVDGRKKLCGDALNEALDLICVNGFSRRIKRDLDRSPRTPEEALRRKWRQLALIHDLDGQQKLEQEEGKQQQQQQLDQLINGAGDERQLRRPRRRITHQCCKQGCSYDDIREYCA